VDKRAYPGNGAEPTSNVRFGPFELDLRGRELRKEGRRIRLQEQPFQILRMLLESPGEVVSREEIRGRLWPNGTVVEFEHSINAAVKRLRDALRDSAEKPRYVETLAGRGYRFVGEAPSTEAPAPAKTVPDGHPQERQAPSTETPAANTSRARLIPWIIAGVFAIVAAATAWFLWPKAAPVRAFRFQVPLPEGATSNTYISVSPDGHKLAFRGTGAQSGLWIRDLDTLEWRKLIGTERGGGGLPFWSPDSRFLGFTAENELKKIDVSGGPPQTLCTALNAGAGAWSPDGTIVFGSRGSGPLRRVSAAGGAPADLTAVDTARGETAHLIPSFLPDGKHFLYLRLSSSDEIAGIYAGSVDAKPAEQQQKRILATRFAARYVDGNLLFMREGTLMAQPFDAGKLQLHGDAVPVAEHVAAIGVNGIFSVSDANVLAYMAGTEGQGYQTTWLDREGKVTGSFGQRGPGQDLALSPEATRATARDAGRAAVPGDIWVLDFARGVRTRLAFRQTNGWFPVWSPDGGRIAFSAGATLDTIYEKSASGTANEKELFKKAGEGKAPTSWSGDGRFLLYFTAVGPVTGRKLWVLPLEGDRKPVLLLGSDFNPSHGSFSPDGRWIAYVSNESGRNEIYVRPFVASGPSLGEGEWPVSKDGAKDETPKWRGDGKEILFSALNNAIMAVDVNGSGAAFQMGAPKQLFIAPANASWDVTRDGERFLMSVAQAQNTRDAITVVLNWQADLKR
jgi:eukaryotic-like serine/threonine-protein kinase